MSDHSAVRLIALFLPQFHPISENDEWWGKGFTEWRNVAKARPLFKGHYQPHIPADLGFYDLRLAETRQAQADLARKYDIHGFCYYHYWFNGKQLLESPINEVLASGKPDFPFCLCWANENWTRRWDGGENEILMQQAYSPEDDLRHIQHLLPFLKDPRYIQVNGRPLLIVYRVDELPDPKQTAEIWQTEARKAGLPGLYLSHVISSGVRDPNPAHYGCDAAVEFQPDWRNLPAPTPPKRCGLRRRVDPQDPFTIHAIRSFPAMVASAMQSTDPEYKVFPCVTPGWDNSPRRKRQANIFVENSPELYESWLRHAIRTSTRRFSGDERLVFINAWNEWAEGNHLEPDLRWGHAYLQATRNALQRVEPSK
jgi:lipopolysaccharide biosynthesis protein